MGVKLRQLLDDETRLRTLMDAKARRPKGHPVWVFGFGSLMWNPCFKYDAKVSAEVHGYERKFHIWTMRARGTPEKPGLGLCLEDGGGTCRGIAYRLVEDDLEDAWRCLWDREMGSGIYSPVWVPIETDGHGEVTALTFVVNRDHPHYAGQMPLDDMAKIMAIAQGNYGLNRDYLAGTVSEMDKLNVRDEELERLLSKVDSICAEVKT